MKTKHKEKILALRSEGKSYNEIAFLVGCSKGTIAYHCGEGQKKKASNRTIKHRKKAINKHKHNLDSFVRRKLKCKSEKFTYKKDYSRPLFTVDDLIEKFGKNPICYLTGRRLSWHIDREVSFDHIIPISRGGDNTINNLGICHLTANLSKSDMIIDEYVSLCKEVLLNFGYKVVDP